MNPNENTIEMHAIVRGNVHGVGFRATARFFAQELGLTGTAQNLPDGTVELFAQGSKERLQQFIDKLNKHFSAYVHSMDISFNDVATPLHGFCILY
jgi:acylphosphatase